MNASTRRIWKELEHLVWKAWHWRNFGSKNSNNNSSSTYQAPVMLLLLQFKRSVQAAREWENWRL